MADVRPIKVGTNATFEEIGGTDTIPASIIGIVPKFEVPSGTINGSNTAFTLSSTPVASASVCIFLDGIAQQNGTDYTVSGTSITFLFAPATGSVMWAVYNNAGSAGGGDFSSNTSSSVDGEIMLFSGTSGKLGKRATGTGLVKATSGVFSALSSASATAELDNVVGDSGSGGTKGLVPAPGAGDAAANKFLKASGAFTTVPATVGITFVIDGGGSAITTGSKGFLIIPKGGTINQWTVVADQSGSIVVDVKRSTYSGFPTTTSIVGGSGNKPTLSSAQKNQATPTSWTSTSIADGDVLEFNVDSATTVTRITLMLQMAITL